MLSVALALASSWTMILGGDVMLNGVKPSAKVWSGLGSTVRNADVALANLEIPWTTATKSTSAKSAAELKAKTQFILKADPKHGPFFASAGWDMVSQGNNHAMDYGWAGLSQTQTQLKSRHIVFAGAGQTLAEATKPAVFHLKDGTRVGLISAMAFVGTGALSKTTPATKSRAGVHGLDLGGAITESSKAKVQAWIDAAKKKCDILVVALHWGTEKRTIPNAYQVSLGRAVIEAGASIVWGHHPHVLQGAEFYRGRPIFYSAGNLVSPKGGTTALFKLTFRNKRFAGVDVIPARISGGSVGLLHGKDAEKAAANFEQLCRSVQAAFPNRNSTLPTRS